MITAVHTLIFSDDPDATRAFFRDIFEWPYVDAHGGWLIFKTGPSEMGVHPSSSEYEGEVHTYGLKHQVTLMCDDVAATVAELKAKGVVFIQDVVDQGYGLVTEFEVPHAGTMQLYEPKHPEAFSL